MIRFKATRWNSEALARRLCLLIYGLDEVIGVGRGPHTRWVIGPYNNFTLHVDNNEEFILNFRDSESCLGRMTALAPVLEWLLDLEIIEVVETVEATEAVEAP